MRMHSRGGVVARTTLLLLAALFGFVLPAAAQTGGQARPAITIQVPNVIQVEPSTETALPIRVVPEAAVARHVMVLIRGLSADVALSEGRLFDSGVWAIRIADLARLKLASPSKAGLKSQLAISAVALDGSVLAEAASTLVVVPPQTTGAVAAAKPDTKPTAAVAGVQQEEKPAAAPAAKTLTHEEKQRVYMFMGKANEHMETGNVNVARLFYKRAVDLGWSAGALALAATYDPVELQQMNTLGGIQPDVKLAQQWYAKALELGAAEAQQRLARLSGR